MKRINHVLILGGGSAGWMSAIYLNKLLNQKGSLPTRITLLESPDVDVIGVGESTFDHMRAFMSDMDIPEADFVHATDATLKHGIYFQRWLHGREQGDGYFHPFEFPQLSSSAALVDHWIGLHCREQAGNGIADSIGIQFKFAKAGKSPKLFNSPDYQGPLNYAYHIDAVLLGRFLRQVAIDRGVNHVVDHCTNVELDQQGDIEALITKDSGRIEADFFIDCTGFANVLMRSQGNTDFVDYSDKLLCDRAVAVRVPCSEGEPWQPRPYTSSIAQECGWNWDIDLYRRRGTGYVYSSNHSSEQRAEEVLRQYLGASENLDLDVRHLKMRVGRLQNIWSRNCVAIGLSAGFIEPLESTGILFIDLGLRFLGELLSGTPAPEAHIKRYNKVMGQLMDNTRDFIMLHYLLTRREDSEFWKAYKHNIKPTDSLVEKMALWKTKVPSTTDFSDAVSPFSAPSHSFIMYGLEWQHASTPATVAHLDPIFGQQLMSAMASHQKNALAKAPDHIDVITALRERARVC